MAIECWCLEIHGRANQDYNQVNSHWQLDVTSSLDLLVNGDALIEGWKSNLEAAWLDLMSEAYQIERLLAYRVKPAGSPQSSFVYQDGDAEGTGGTSFAANGLCPSIRLIPPINTISAGKIFLPCVPIEFIVDNQLAGGYDTAIEDYMDLTITGFSEGPITANAAIYSRKNDSFTLVVGYTLSPVYGFQRRRQRPF